MLLVPKINWKPHYLWFPTVDPHRLALRLLGHSEIYPARSEGGDFREHVKNFGAGVSFNLNHQKIQDAN